MLRNPAVYVWRPTGLSDARDDGISFPGACRELTNFIHDPTSANLFAPRPAATVQVDLSGFSPAGPVSVLESCGTHVFGMYGDSTGHDIPFCYDTATGAFQSITGVTASNVPTTQATTGAWVPPKAVVVGNYIVITHPGYNAGTGLIGIIDVSTFAYSTGNLTQAGTGRFASPPGNVAMFNDRAWYAYGNQVYFSDPLSPLTQTDAGQFLTVGEVGESVTGMIAQGISTATQGILQALLIFKPNSIWQVTGDWNYGTAVGGNLALNQITSSIGCSAPRTIAATPVGVLFMAVDGVRTIPTLSMVVSEPNKDVVYPFYNVATPSRAAAAYAGDTYRISLDTVTATGQIGRVEYWFSFKANRWSGPHTFPADDYAPFGNAFSLVTNSAPSTVWISRPYCTGGDTFVENGVQLQCNMRSVLINPQPPMSEKASIELTAGAVFGANPYIVQILSSSNGLLNQGIIQSASSTALWGTSGLVWGQPGATWNPAPYNVAVGNVEFPAPSVFKTCQIVISGQGSLYFRFSRISFRYEALQYTGQG